MKLMNNGDVINLLPCKDNRIPKYLAKRLMQSKFKIEIANVPNVDGTVKVTVHKSNSIYFYLKIVDVWYYTSDNRIFNYTWFTVPLEHVARRVVRAAKFSDKYVYCDSGRDTSSYLHEKNDCTVRALSKACGFTYDEAHQILSNAGRQDGQGFQLFNYCLHNLLDGFTFERVMLKTLNTLYKFTAAKLSGNYLVFTAGHVQCVIDGVCYDRRFLANGRILYILKVLKGDA